MYIWEYFLGENSSSNPSQEKSWRKIPEVPAVQDGGSLGRRGGVPEGAEGHIGRGAEGAQWVGGGDAEGPMGGRGGPGGGPMGRGVYKRGAHLCHCLDHFQPPWRWHRFNSEEIISSQILRQKSLILLEKIINGIKKGKKWMKWNNYLRWKDSDIWLHENFDRLNIMNLWVEYMQDPHFHVNW